MTTLSKPPRSKGVLNASGRPTTRRDYEKALEAIKLLTDNVMREPLKAFGKHKPLNTTGMRALFV